MIRILLVGICGAMGKEIVSQVETCDDLEIVAGIDKNTENNSVPIFDDINKCDIDADVIIDFSTPLITDEVIDFSVTRNIPLIICTTGLSDNTINHINDAKDKLPILRSANMSIGINTVVKLLKEASKILSEKGFDIEIVEKHHNRKKDAPSGTAILLADAINDSLDNKYEYVFDRSDKSEARSKNEIGISAIRGGTITGDHDVIFAGLDETITISHRAYSRAIFAKGALSAARFLVGQKPGLYDMSNVIK